MFSNKFDEKTKDKIKNVVSMGAGATVATQATKKYWMPHAKSALHNANKAMSSHTSLKAGDAAFKKFKKSYFKAAPMMLGSTIAGAAVGKATLEAVKRYSNRSNS